MSLLFDRLKSSEIMKEIDPKDSPFSVGKDKEGAPYLFYNMEEFEDLMGHEVKFFPNGVLLSLKDKFKQKPDEQSFIFYNNKKQIVLNVTNSKILNSQAPNNDYNIVVHRGFIEVTETNRETLEKETYFKSIKTCNKVVDVFNTDDIVADDKCNQF